MCKKLYILFGLITLVFFGFFAYNFSKDVDNSGEISVNSSKSEFIRLSDRVPVQVNLPEKYNAHVSEFFEGIYVLEADVIEPDMYKTFKNTGVSLRFSIQPDMVEDKILQDPTNSLLELARLNINAPELEVENIDLFGNPAIKFDYGVMSYVIGFLSSEQMKNYDNVPMLFTGFYGTYGTGIEGNEDLFNIVLDSLSLVK